MIPKPLKLQAGTGTLALAHLTRIVGRCCDQEAGLRLADELNRRLKTPYIAPLPMVEGGVAEGSIVLIEDASLSLGAEGYELIITKQGVTMRGGSEAGLFYGIQTLSQLVEGHGAHHARFPVVRIEDRPRFAWRGVMIDSARHFQQVSVIEDVIDTAARLKMNRFHWHLTDDQAWRVEIDAYPRLTEVAAWRPPEAPASDGRQEGGYYTKHDIRHIVEYARQRHITVIPEIDMPGHSTAAMVAYPELSCAGKPVEIGRGWNAYVHAGRLPFCAGKEATFRFLEQVMTELADMIDTPYLHIGGDERPTGVWSECSHCQAAMRKHQLQNEDQLQNWFQLRMIRFIHEQLKRQTISWADLMDLGFPKDHIIQGGRTGEALAAAAAGHRAINSAHESTYLDYPWDEASNAGKPDWMLILPADKAYQFDPVKGLEPASHHLMQGGETPLWTEYVETTQKLQEYLWPRLPALAETFWSVRRGCKWDEFAGRLKQQQVQLCAWDG